ncbi:LysR family transcriptional regulator [Rouxiella sp. Mn2063]|uniref:LysR family transcriptional regulator n=1 Tax=Rouxiella sp. Mn2063 TaxID=3395262 RepID=UPI003BDBD11C
MRQNQLDGIVTFIVVAEERSFSAAAVRLGISPSAVSQSVRTLEQRLGVTLFSRTTRSVSLTEAGTQFMERTLPCVQELISASEEAGQDGDTPTGLLRINIPRSAHLILLQPLLRHFLDAWPGITLEVMVDNALVDIVGRAFDAGIRFGEMIDKDMVSVPLSPPVNTYLVASPDYVERHGIPLHPTELLHHDCIVFRHNSSGQRERWNLSKDGENIVLPVTGRFIINDSLAMMQAALDGVGITWMIGGYVEKLIEEGRLLSILPEWCPQVPGYCLYYPDRRQVSLKLRVFIDFLKQQLENGITPDIKDTFSYQ